MMPHKKVLKERKAIIRKEGLSKPILYDHFSLLWYVELSLTFDPDLQVTSLIFWKANRKVNFELNTDKHYQNLLSF